MRVIGIVSGKGGVGKTTVTVNLACALAQMGKDVVIVDCNVTTSHVGFYFGLQYYPITLNHVLRGESEIESAIYAHPCGIKIIPASLSLEELKGVNIDLLKDCIKNLKKDFILLDSAPGFGREALSVLKSCNEVLFVTIPFMNAVTDVCKALNLLEILNLKPLGVVVNMVRNKSYELRKEEIEALTGLKVLAEIPYDPFIELSLAKSKPSLLFNPYSPSSRSFYLLASQIVGESFNLPKIGLKAKIKNFFWKLFL